jgi:hypothetical protein
MVVGTEAKEMGLECRPGGDKCAGGGNFLRPESSGGDDEEVDEDREEEEVTPHPHSPLPKDLPTLGDIFRRDAGIFVGAR